MQLQLVTVQFFKMRVGFVIFIQILVIQNVFSKEILKHNNEANYFNRANGTRDMVIFDVKERSLTDIWNNIKNTAEIAWNALKNLATNTKEKIKIWINDVKEKAIVIAKSFEERLKALKEKIINIIQNVLGDEGIKKCFQDENEAMNAILKNIIDGVTICISNKINGLTAIEDFKWIDDVINESDFMAKIEANLNTCIQNNGNAEVCLKEAKDTILKETNALEDAMLKSRQESRNYADNILEAVITCSTEGLIEASAAIVNEVINIIRCITQSP